MEFLVFARLAAADPSALTPGWTWGNVVAAACPAIASAFSAANCRERYGAAAVATMRRVASLVYGACVEDVRSAAHMAADAMVKSGPHGSSTAWLADASLFDGVGGAAVWAGLLRELPPVECIAEAAPADGPDGARPGPVGAASARSVRPGAY